MTTTHLAVEDGFGKFTHTHPFTGETWTEETAKTWRRKCEGSGRSGGRAIRIERCDCTLGDDAPRIPSADFIPAN